MNNLRKITSAEQISGAKYYSNEYKRIGHKHIEWTTLYNADFEPIEDVEVIYTNALLRLTRIVKASQIDHPKYLAYDLKKLNNDFYAVEKNEDTSDTLKDISKALNPKNWN